MVLFPEKHSGSQEYQHKSPAPQIDKHRLRHNQRDKHQRILELVRIAQCAGGSDIGCRIRLKIRIHHLLQKKSGGKYAAALAE